MKQSSTQQDHAMHAAPTMTTLVGGGGPGFSSGNVEAPPEEEVVTLQPHHHHLQSAYAYPLKGLGFLVHNPQLWGCVLVPIVASLAIGAGLFVLFLACGLYPQALLFTSFTHLPPWAAWLIALALVFLETILFSFLLSQIFLERARNRLYAKVFELSGMPYEQVDRVIYGTGNQYFQWVSQRVIFLFLVAQMAITYPINALPVIGSFAYAGMNGVSLAWALHGVYFEKKGLSFLQQWKYVKSHLQDYVAFGAVAVLLDSIPLLNIIFFYSNIVGSALWAVDMERAQELENSMPANALVDDVGIIEAEELQ